MLLQDSQAVCTPTGTPLTIAVTQIAGEGDVRCRSTIPIDFDGRGRTAETTDEEHVRDLIEQVLFTTPGERVNRPTFGSGLLQLVFAPNSDALASSDAA